MLSEPRGETDFIEAAREQAARANPAPDTIGSAAVPASSDALAGPLAAGTDALPGYQILRELHRGGQGVVYEAVQLSTHRKVAVKVMRTGALSGAADLARFEREVQVLGQLRHPNIVAIHDSGEVAGNRYFVMDYVSGLALDRWFAQLRAAAGPRSDEKSARLFSGSSRVRRDDSRRAAARRALSDGLRLMVKVCDAVQAAHQRGIVHRDLKPSNIRVDAAGEPFVLDFGLAKLALAGDDSIMTITGEFLGSLPWAAPEQALGQPARIDARTDVYALGVILYQLLAGRFPYDVSGNMHAVLDNILYCEPPPPSRAPVIARGAAAAGTSSWVRAMIGTSRRRALRQVDQELDCITLKCLAKNPDERYATAGQLADDLRRYLNSEPIEARRGSRAYALRKSATRWTRRHPVVTAVLVVVPAALFAQLVGTPLIFEWTPLQLWYERLALRLSPVATWEAFEHVRVIAITDRTDVEALARREGLADVRADNWMSVRRLHGRLMEKLAGSGLRALAFDIAFRGETPFDEDLVRGVRALRASDDHPVPVLVSVPDWGVDERGLPQLSRRIAPEVSWGSTTGDFDQHGSWAVELFLQRGDADLRASLSLATFAAARRPESAVEFDFVPKVMAVICSYWRFDPSLPAARVLLDEQDRIPVTTIRAEAQDTPSRELRRGDWVGYLEFELPPDAVLDAATLEYGRVFSDSAELLRRWLDGRVVVVGDSRSGVDRLTSPDGRTLPGYCAIASSIEGLLRRALISRPHPYVMWLFVGVAAGAGVLIAAYFTGRRRAVVISAAFLAALVAAVWAYASLRYLCNPGVPLLALILGSELWALRRRAMGPGADVLHADRR